MDEFQPLKKALTYDEQVQHLADSHGVSIPNRQAAVQILQSVNYYRLTGYGIGLEDKSTGLYKEGTTIETLYSLYCFDSALRNILSPVIEDIEIRFRTAIAYYLGTTYGPECYRDRKYFDSWISGVTGEDMFDKFNRDVDDAIKKQAKKPFVAHHQSVYGGHFPIWVIVEALSLGSLSSLYSILKKDDANKIAKVFKSDSAFMRSWFASLVEIRNICAHYGRLYNMPLDSSPKMAKGLTQYANRRLFSVCLALQYIIGNKETWRVFIKRLVDLLSDHLEVNLAFLGFPDNWRQYLRSY